MTNKILQITLLLFAYLTTINATTYYVTTEGNDSNDGLTESTAWKTIKYATSQATAAGDIVYIKAGIYNEYSIKVSSGSSGNPITLEGYKDAPGDIINIDWWDFHTNRGLDPTKMPLLDGGDRSKKVAISLIDNNNIKIKNLQITNYENGIYGYNVTNCHLENIILLSFGKPSSNGQLHSGTGIHFSNGTNNLFRKCLIANVAAEAMAIENNDNSLIEECKVYCDEGYTGKPDVNLATDYYMNFSGDNNIIKECYIERVGNLDHGGAGIGIKAFGENNLFENCTAKGLGNAGFYVRHSGVTNNEFRNCTALNGTGFVVRDGAHHNTFNYCRTDSCIGVFFTWSGEDIVSSGNDNNFYNCIFENSSYMISFGGSKKDAKANDNSFVNCVFDGSDYLFRTGRNNEGNKMINCAISNVSEYKYTRYSNYRNVHMEFINTNFWNMGFDIPYNENSTYTNILKVNPRFVDADNSDYHLEYNSQLIDAGLADMSAYNLPELDYYGNPRFFDSKEKGVATIDIGVHEYPTITDVEDEIITPTKFELLQNYPNPFNPSTVISFTLPTSQNVMLAVYNVLGEKVAELIDGEMSAGNHSVTFDASNFSSGIYIYRISADNFASNKKMLLIK